MLHPQRGRSNDTALLQSICCNIHLQQEQEEDLRPFTALPRKRKYNKIIEDIFYATPSRTGQIIRIMHNA